MAAFKQGGLNPYRGMKISNLSLTKFPKISRFRAHEGALAFLLF
jgi:hypothetical protein